MPDWALLLLKVLFILFGLLTLAGGLLLLKRGLWPRRKGTDPHCRHCEYNLTGLQEGICPECGQPWTLATAGKGHRQRRPRWVIGGSLLMLAACLWFLIPVADRLAYVNYFSLLPTRAVLLFVDASGSPTDQRAIGEIAARLTAGTVPAEQAERFFRKVTRFGLKVRQKVIEGEQVPYQVEHANPAIKGVSLTQTIGSTEIDGQGTKDHSFGTCTTSLAYPNGGSWGSSLQCPAVGQHTIQMDSVLRFTWATPGGAPGACQYRVPLQGQFEVLPAGSSETVKAIPNAGLQGQLQRCVSVNECDIESVAGQSPRIWLMLHADHSPVDLAFDVFVRVDGTEYPLSEATLRRNGNYGDYIQSEYKGPATQAVDVILRSSPKAARHTVDLTEIWEGELVFADVPLKVRGANGPAVASRPVVAPASNVDSAATEGEPVETK